MFYCNKCAIEKRYPQSIGKSHEKCEICGNQELCNDVPSKYLSIPEKNTYKWETHTMFGEVEAYNLKEAILKSVEKHIENLPYFDNSDNIFGIDILITKKNR